ncbi:hypothetical protein F3K02_08940 [Hydrogenophaga sp. D2P1]|uniref:Holin n=1 Tax=Hydrogenophaga aromaticivorans TaxID=2610898 RepID=A0A7Y8GVQ5_9BURK|nr:hypothetical protein [Hydrogenophaga aromaticivorans]NWF45371.1 hypothetical protein [Hydrogenophaga aromaticivorans]
MNEDPSIWTVFGAFALKVLKSHFFIGLIGALVSLRGVPGSTWRIRYLNSIAGMLISGFWTPALAEYFVLDSDATIAALAFALGLFGLNLVDASRERAVELIRNTKLSDFIPGKKGE